MSRLAALLALVVLAGCAKDPGKIQPITFPAGAYAHYSCEQLEQEWKTNENNLILMSKQQSSAAAGDAIGVFLVGIPISSLGGGDHEAEIATFKGRKLEIEAEQKRKQCGATVSS